MKVYTQKEFDAIKRDEYGVKNCPKGDYTQIKSFPELCSFGGGCRFDERCRFGERCGFGERCSYEADRVINGTYFACDRIGSAKRKTYFFKGDNGCFVRAGCFFGTFDEFAVKVKETHGGTKFEREYLAALELAKIVLEIER